MTRASTQSAVAKAVVADTPAARLRAGAERYRKAGRVANAEFAEQMACDAEIMPAFYVNFADQIERHSREVCA